jgi:uncharacterized membrane protein
MKTSRITLIMLLVAFYAIALALFSRMPEPMATHWNAQGDVNGYISRFWGMFLMPFVTTGLALFFLAIPLIDPLKSNIAKFRGYFDWFITGFTGYMLFLYILTLLWNLDFRFNMFQVMLPVIAVFFFFVGVLIGKAKRNYFIGIRTPWTLNNDEVWDRTHRFGGQAFKIAAVICLLGIFWPKIAIWFLLVPVFVVTVVTVIYSYVIYQKVAAKNGKS